MKLKNALLPIGRKHLFHMVQPSIWPFLVSCGFFLLLSGFIYYIHRIYFGSVLVVISLGFIIFCAYSWFSDIITESTYLGQHTLIVKRGLKRGFLLFLVSEFMLFFGFFWALFHSAICPSILLGSIWPPIGLKVISTWGYPFFNTALLVISGFGVTWSHRGIALGLFTEAVDGLLIAIILGIIFLILQCYEYYMTDINIFDGIYASTFYMLTGLHGCHVIIGVLFLLVNFIRLIFNHFTSNHYLGFVFSIWYWHFVDVVWIAVFVSVYWWGGYI
jgi:cytochrome c oxidase subunit 3